MRKCWAEILGNCEDKISNEHIVSKSFFESDKILVEGFDWCKENTKIVGLASLTKKCLCRKHNSLLNNLDNVASHTARILKEQSQISIDIDKNPNQSLRKKIFTINARLLERWFLKTLINFSYRENYIIGYKGLETGLPSEELVKIVYGKDKFNKNNGLCVVAKENLRLNFSEKLEFSPLIKDSKYIVGGRFNFWGMYLFLDLTENGMNVAFEEIPNMELSWHGVRLQRKFKYFRRKVGKKTILEVRFNWV